MQLDVIRLVRTATHMHARTHRHTQKFCLMFPSEVDVNNPWGHDDAKLQTCMRVFAVSNPSSKNRATKELFMTQL